jgi:hypothetical protein
LSAPKWRQYSISKLTHVGRQPVSFFGGVRCWLVSPEKLGPDGLGAPFGFALLFPARKT